jgi:hypothetical protein
MSWFSCNSDLTAKEYRSLFGSKCQRERNEYLKGKTALKQVNFN